MFVVGWSEAEGEDFGVDDASGGNVPFVSATLSELVALLTVDGGARAPDVASVGWPDFIDPEAAEDEVEIDGTAAFGLSCSADGCS